MYGYSSYSGKLTLPRACVQYVHYVDEMPAVLADLGNRLHVLSGTNTDSGRATKEASFEGIANFELERDTLFDVLTECRVVRAPCPDAMIGAPMAAPRRDVISGVPLAVKWLGCDGHCSDVTGVQWTLQ